MSPEALACSRLLDAHLRTGMFWPKTMAAHIERHGQPRLYSPPTRPEPVKRTSQKPRQVHHFSMPEIICNQKIEEYLGFHGAVLAGISRKTGITIEEMLSPRRKIQIVKARTRVAKILRRRGYSLNAIGRVLGGRDHSTIMHMLGLKRRAQG